MNKRFLEILPFNLQNIVNEIESYSGVEIQVKPNPYPVNVNDPNPNILACKITEFEIIIYYRNLDNFEAKQVAHELLHLRRYSIEKIPQILPKNADNIEKTSQIECALEHLVIIPIEKGLVENYDVNSYWNWVEALNWSRYHTWISDWARRANCLLGWLYASFIVTDPEVKKAATNCILEEGLKEEAKLFANKIQKVMNNKQESLSTVCRFLNIPFNDVVLVTFDIKNRERLIQPLPRI